MISFKKRNPSAEVFIGKLDISIYKYLPKELIICILDSNSNNWDNWDLYITNYLTFNKLFRNTVTKIFSKNEINSHINNQRQISLDNDGLTKYFNEYDKLFSFVITKQDKNQLVTFK